MTADDLRALRERHRLSQVELASKIGYAPNHIYMVESGRRAMTERLERAVELALGMVDTIAPVVPPPSRLDVTPDD